MGHVDIPPAVSLAREVGWSDLTRDYTFFVEHPQCLALVAEEGGEVIGTGFGTRNGGAGWIGFIVVSENHRGRSIGTAMTRAVMDRLRGSGCRTLVLTATELGRPVYEKLGFTVETHYQQFSGPAPISTHASSGLRSVKPEDLDVVCAFDQRMTGEDCSHLIRALSHSGLVMDDETSGGIRAYHLPTPWGNRPIIAADPEAGWLMLRAKMNFAESAATTTA